MTRLLPLLCFIILTIGWSHTVESIIVEGNKYVEDKLIKSLLNLREGSTYSEDIVREDIKRLYRTGFFKKIEVYKEEKNGKVKIIYRVEDLPVIYKIEFKGNEEISTDDLIEKLGIETEVGKVDIEEMYQGTTGSPAIEEKIEIMKRFKLGRILSPSEIENLRRRIIEIYRKEGFYNAKVDYKIIPKKGASKLVFVIEEKQALYVRKVRFVGNKSFSRFKLGGIMETKSRNIFLFRWKPPFNRDTLEEDIKKLEEFYKSEGFLEVKISYELKKIGERYDITIYIEEGPRYKLKELKIEGNNLFTYKELVSNHLRKNKGGYYRREVIEKIKNNIRSKYMDLGFLNLRIKELENTDKVKKEVSLTLSINEGEPIYVGKVDIKGNYETRDYVIRRELRFREGGLLRMKDIIRSRTRIFNLGYYEDVQITPVPSSRNVWDLRVKVRERLTGQISAGVGYSEVTGLSGFGSISKGNFLGMGDIISLSISYGTYVKNNSFSYTRKWFLRQPMDLKFSLYDRGLIYRTYTVYRQGFDFILYREFWEYWRWSGGISVQRIEYTDIEDTAPSIIKAQEGARNSRRVLFSIIRDTRDNYLFPSSGSYTDLSYTVALPIANGQERFHKVTLSHSKYFKDEIFDTETILSIKGTVGFVNAYDNTQVPLDERFFLGGDFTIRGYYYGYAGPLDSAGNPIGAEKEFYLNIELNYPIYKNMLYVALFHDTGFGVDDWKDVNPGVWRGGYGIGLRLVTPIAPLRLDWAFKTVPTIGDSAPSRIHFVLGAFY